MGWKDLMKNVTDKATSIAETAQEKLEEQKQLSAIKKEEQNKKMEEMNERVTEYEQEVLQSILSGFSGASCIDVEDNILDFTKDYFEKLLLPANSVSASKITMYPYSDKIQKKAQKALREYDDTETPVFQFEGNKGEFILMTPTKLYIAVAFPENQTFVANVAVDLQQVSQLGFVSTEEGYQVVCNGVELVSGAVRNHDIEIMLKAFTMAGYTEEEVKSKFGALYTAFQFGAPPHAGIAPGIDRMLMLLTDSDTIREVIAFPLNSKAQDLMMGAPGNVRRDQLRDIHIQTGI